MAVGRTDGGRARRRPARYAITRRDDVRGLLQSPSRDAGAAIVEFVMVSVLLLMLLFGVLQVGAIFYVRNVVAASAADGARFAAGADVDTAEGAPRASDLIRRGLSDSAARTIRCQAAQVADGDSGLQLTRVECRGRIGSLFVPVGRFITIDIVGRAVKEGQ